MATSAWGVDHGDSVSKAIDFKRAEQLQRSFKAKGKTDLERRAFQVAARSDRGPAGQRQLSRQQSLRDIEGSERQGVGRAGRKRGVTWENTSDQVFRRSQEMNRRKL